MGSVLNEVFGELEGRYEKKQLKEFTKITSSKRIHKSDYVESGIPFYRSKEIILKSNMIELTDILYILEETFIDFKNTFGVPKEGDILITAVGTIGVTYLVNANDKFYFKDGNLIWLRDIKDELNKKYLLYIKPPIKHPNYGTIPNGKETRHKKTNPRGPARVAISDREDETRGNEQ